MEARFINGSTVNRVWGDTSTELMGVFQYETDAIAFAVMKVGQEAASERDYRPDYAITCTLNGKLTLIRGTPGLKQRTVA